MVLIGDTMFTNLSVVKESGFRNASFKFAINSTLTQLGEYAFDTSGLYGEINTSVTELPYRVFARTKITKFSGLNVAKVYPFGI